jgi:hypothetical protein
MAPPSVRGLDCTLLDESSRKVGDPTGTSVSEQDSCSAGGWAVRTGDCREAGSKGGSDMEAPERFEANH